MDPDRDNPYAPPETDSAADRRPPDFGLRGAAEDTPHVVARYALSADEFLRSHRNFSRYAFPPRKEATYVATLGICLAASLLLQKIRPASPVATIGIFVSCVALLFPILRRLGSRKQRFVGLKGEGQQTEWRIGPTRVRAVGPASDSILRWEVFAKGVQTREGIMLFRTPQFFHWLPRHAFADDGDFAKALGWAQGGIAEFVELDPHWRDAPCLRPDRAES